MITIELWNIQETTLTAANFPSKFGILQTVTLDDLVDAHLTRPGAVSSDLWAPRRGNRKGQAMNTKMMKNVMTLGAGGALVAGAVAIATASPSWTMPVLPNTAAVTTAASNQITDVRYYRRGYYGRGYGRGYYGRGYRRGYYGRGYYGRGYGYGGYPYAYSNPFPFGYGWGGW
jgi:hypothetical protein